MLMGMVLTTQLLTRASRKLARREQVHEERAMANTLAVVLASTSARFDGGGEATLLQKT